MNEISILLKKTETKYEIIPETIEIESTESQIENGEIVIMGICSCKLKYKAKSQMIVEQAI